MVRLKSKLGLSYCLIALVVLLLAGLGFGDVAGAGKIKVLVLDGFSNHDWKATTEFIQETLEGAGIFEVDVSTAPAEPNSAKLEEWLPEFSKYDVVIQNTNNIRNKKLRWSRRVQEDLENYVKSGHGLYIFHSANNAFEDWEEYDRMIGLGWRLKDRGTALEITGEGEVIEIPAGKGKGTYHGPWTEAVIKILNRHPINFDFPREWKTPDLEVYKYARGPAENLTVLSYAYDETTKKNWPIDWIVEYGSGRVYNSTFGHIWKGQENPESTRCVGFLTSFIRAVEWLAKEKVTLPVPDDFPTAEKIVLSDY